MKFVERRGKIAKSYEKTLLSVIESPVSAVLNYSMIAREYKSSVALVMRNLQIEVL